VGESVAGGAGLDDLSGEGEAVDDCGDYLDLPLPAVLPGLLFVDDCL